MNRLDQNPSQRSQLMMNFAMEQAFTALALPILELRTWLIQQIESNPLLILTPAEEIFLPLHDESIAAPQENEAVREVHCHIPLHDQPLAEYLMSDIDEHGILLEPVDQIANRFTVSPSDVRRVIEKIRAILPSHLCSESMKEALLRKLLSMQHEHAPLFHEAYDDLLKKRYASVMKKWNISFESLQNIVKNSLMTHPSPTPSLTIFPDIILQENGNSLIVDERSSLLPGFTFHSEYVALAQDDPQFLRRYTAQAKWLNRIVSRRHKILECAAQEIAVRQYGYLSGETSTIAPIKTQELCTTLQCHESTLARALSNKYIETPLGIFPMRRFFSGHTPFHIEQLLSEAVAKERKDAPLSDEELSSLIEKRGIPCARRTVAKYRKMLGIPRASFRRRH